MLPTNWTYFHFNHLLEAARRKDFEQWVKAAWPDKYVEFFRCVDKINRASRIDLAPYIKQFYASEKICRDELTIVWFELPYIHDKLDFFELLGMPYDKAVTAIADALP